MHKLPFILGLRKPELLVLRTYAVVALICIVVILGLLWFNQISQPIESPGLPG